MTRHHLVLFALAILCLGILSAGCTGTNSSMTPVPSVTPAPSVILTPTKLYGIDFSPYMDGQDPDYGATVNDTQIHDRMRIIAPHTSWIRTYGMSGGLEDAGAIAHELGLKAAVGAWLSGDMAANEREIDALIAEAKAGNVDLAIVGSETLYRGDLNESQLIAYIRQVKQAVPNVTVTTADTYEELIEHPKVLEACDVIMFNYYPYFEGVGIDAAIPAMDVAYRDMVSRSNGKAVIISETGWPSAGNSIGKAVPSSDNSSRFCGEFVNWAMVNNASYYYFDAFDEAWKARSEGPQGAHWGVWDKDGRLKPGMEQAIGA